VFQDVGLWAQHQVAVTGRDAPEQVSAVSVTDGTLPLVGVRVRTGRHFTAEEDLPTGPQVVMLSDGYWQRQFGGSASALGQVITIDGIPREIVGILPPGFRFMGIESAVYLPFRFNRSEARMGNFSYQGIARLRPGVTMAQAHAEMERLIPQAVERYPGGITMAMIRQARFAPIVRPLKADVIGDVGKVLWVLLGTVGIILLIACANVANLFLVRAEGLQRELAVRTALGASWWRVAGELLRESLTLGVLAGIAGIGLAWAGVRLLAAIGPERLPRLHEVTIDPIVVAFAALLAVLTGLLFGAIPAIKYGRPELAAALKEGGRGTSVGRERHRARNVLVIAQVALALVLLIGSGLMIRSFQALRDVDPGFRDPARVLTLRLAVPRAQVEDMEQAARVHEAIAQRLAQIPGVEGVGMSSSITMDGSSNSDPVYVEEVPPAPGQLPPIRRLKSVSPGWFETMGNPVRAGRVFEWRDVHERRNVAVVSESFAREYWGEPARALGKRLSSDLEGTRIWQEIVGVVGNEHDDGVDQKAPPVVYGPLVTNTPRGVESPRSLGYVIRSPRVGSTTFMDQVRQAVWGLNPDLPLARVRTLQVILDESMARTSFTLIMLAIAASVALLLGAVGIYGVISYIVAQRTREIGVRIALGAQRADVSRMVLSRGLVLALSGVAAGLAAAAGLARLMTALLFGVQPFDPVTYAAVSTAVAAIALVACWIPARRAARIAPVEALRAD
jgi:predicted permease